MHLWSSCNRRTINSLMTMMMMNIPWPCNTVLGLNILASTKADAKIFNFSCVSCCIYCRYHLWWIKAYHIGQVRPIFWPHSQTRPTYGLKVKARRARPRPMLPGRGQRFGLFFSWLTERASGMWKLVSVLLKASLLGNSPRFLLGNPSHVEVTQEKMAG